MSPLTLMKRLGVGPTLLLGVIIERVSGQPLGTFLRERILTPCSFARSPTAAKKFPAEHAPTAGPVRVRARERHFYALGPAGIWSTSGDLVRWADNYRTGGVGGSALLMRVLDGPRSAVSSPRHIPALGMVP